MAQPDNFSVIIPTYTGEEHIGKCFESLLSQKKVRPNYEVIVIIDGPNDSLRAIVDQAAEKFKKRGIDFTIHQFKKNQGRLDARLKGAELARYKQLLFIDDRITLAGDYLEVVTESDANILMPNVLETEAKNGINRCLYLLRRRIYGKDKFGTSFTSFYVEADNFEKTPKGTTSLWIPQKEFINASQAVVGNKSNKDVSDDTKMLRWLIDDGQKIYKCGEAKIYYNPRSSKWEELKHMFARGPKFVDYYASPDTRFFKPLVLSLVLALACLLLMVFYPKLIIWLIGVIFIADILLTVAVAEKPADLRLFFFFPLIGASFALGVLKGLLRKIATI